MEDKISLKDSQRQWQILLKRKQDSDRILRPQHLLATTITENYREEDDPFDCSDLRFPSVAGLVDDAAAAWVQEWKELDERKIIFGQGMNANSNEPNGNEPAAAAAAAASRKRPYWLDKHVRLPEHFDYATRQDGPPPSTDNDDNVMNDDRVLSLHDPTKTTSYHAELWKLFASIPTAKQLEQDAMAGGMTRLPHSIRLRDEMEKEGNKNRDLYRLSRLRMSDRHSFPSSNASSAVALVSGLSINQQPSEPVLGSIVLECWKRQPKRGSMPDPSRAVLEFLGSQTLYDVHCALIDLTEDEFWNQVVVVSGNVNDSSNTKNKDEESSGLFFIEDIFYTTGSVDYVTPIQNWLQGNGEKNIDSSRALGLGINSRLDSLPVRSMKEMRLDEIEMRLGVRYLHVHHGNVECSVFLVDRQYSCSAVDAAAAAAAALTATATPSTATSSFPLLHDVWTPTFATPDCEACSTAAPHSGRGRPAVMATATTCAITDGHRALCLDCARQLALSLNQNSAASTSTSTQSAEATDTNGGQNKKPRLLLQPYNVWRGQADIASDACGDKNF
jgi:snRNA-activating protein complex (SNAPc), subunit 3